MSEGEEITAGERRRPPHPDLRWPSGARWLSVPGPPAPTTTRPPTQVDRTASALPFTLPPRLRRACRRRWQGHCRWAESAHPPSLTPSPSSSVSPAVIGCSERHDGMHVEWRRSKWGWRGWLLLHAGFRGEGGGESLQRGVRALHPIEAPQGGQARHYLSTTRIDRNRERARAAG